jgi:hypothetical protein
MVHLTANGSNELRGHADTRGRPAVHPSLNEWYHVETRDGMESRTERCKFVDPAPPVPQGIGVVARKGDIHPQVSPAVQWLVPLTMERFGDRVGRA